MAWHPLALLSPHTGSPCQNFALIARILVHADLSIVAFRHHCIQRAVHMAVQKASLVIPAQFQVIRLVVKLDYVERRLRLLLVYCH
jgi:hypothetical protein